MATHVADIVEVPLIFFSKFLKTFRVFRKRLYLNMASFPYVCLFPKFNLIKIPLESLQISNMFLEILKKKIAQ